MTAEPRLRHMIDCLRTPLPIPARGVAAANVLLSDMASPVYNRASTLDLSELVSSITSSLDPTTPLFASEPTKGRVN
ncbi:MAG TPA: hypothetical protein VKR27_08045 [Acidimicrobiales bacterium]|nr:hypothetical protein [Acidimicrobiales bacterium]